ncbi:MBL fold metallo-hydrolase [Kineococcus radiotolerans]|uniref:Beta-lactamase domain protein n=1 Tax=Kineococcus radiotolerans (strain ATCC BAA-149 / DSM 14245 / SRS30216) TaxID=266940 RepID=A6WBD1_KINRD|nr:MBL fold metallo-hydrolase [Kineococcus radiotolerans]ABS04120.1 beta-lactamase domain protein [Kineococcus radiotolerans SRS30216 = ATCC BAA-149]
MPSSTPPLDMPVETLRATGTARLPYQQNVLLRSFVLQRPAGNVVVYNSPGITAAAEAIADLGGVSRLLLNHAHEAMYGDPPVDAPVHVHERDLAEAARSMRITATFDHRQVLDDDLEIIPTPGHTPGTTSYLWDSGVHRFLFTGDFLWIEEGEWKAVLLDPGSRQDYLDSLALVRDLDFDVLVPWGTTEGGPCFATTTTAETRERIDTISARLRRGGHR